MWYPTSAVTWVFRGYVLLAPQQVRSESLTACRSSAPHSSADTGTPNRRFVGFSVCPGRADCPLFSTVAIPRVSRPHPLVLVVIPLLLSLCWCNLPAVRYTAQCYSSRLAASVVLLFLLHCVALCEPARCSGGLSPFVSLLFPLGSARPDSPTVSLSVFLV